MTKDADFNFKPGVLTELSKISKESPFFITTNNIGDLRGFVLEKFKQLTQEEKGDLSEADLKRIEQNMIIVHKSYFVSSGGTKNSLIEAILDIFELKDVDLHFTDDQKAYVLDVLKIQDPRIKNTHALTQPQGNKTFTMPTEQNKNTVEELLKEEQKYVQPTTPIRPLNFNDGLLKNNTLLQRRLSRQPSITTPTTPYTPCPFSPHIVAQKLTAPANPNQNRFDFTTAATGIPDNTSDLPKTPEANKPITAQSLLDKLKEIKTQQPEEVTVIITTSKEPKKSKTL